ncbi:MAG: hypothetical protein ACRD0M_13110 [Acidimicrobiales bacterium]
MIELRPRLGNARADLVVAALLVVLGAVVVVADFVAHDPSLVPLLLWGGLMAAVAGFVLLHFRNISTVARDGTIEGSDLFGRRRRWPQSELATIAVCRTFGGGREALFLPATGKAFHRLPMLGITRDDVEHFGAALGVAVEDRGWFAERARRLE